MAKKDLTPYLPKFREAVRWALRDMIKDAGAEPDFNAIKDHYRSQNLALAIHYAKMAEDPKPAIIRVFLMGKAMRTIKEDYRPTIFGTQETAICAELDNPPANSSDLGREASEALKNFLLHERMLDSSDEPEDDEDDDFTGDSEPAHLPGMSYRVH